MVEEPLVGESQLAYWAARSWLAVHQQWQMYVTARPSAARAVAQLALPAWDWLQHRARRKADPLYAHVHAKPLQSWLPDSLPGPWWRNIVSPRFVLVLLACCAFAVARSGLNHLIAWRSAALQRRRDPPSVEGVGT